MAVHCGLRYGAAQCPSSAHRLLPVLTTRKSAVPGLHETPNAARSAPADATAEHTGRDEPGIIEAAARSVDPSAETMGWAGVGRGSIGSSGNACARTHAFGACCPHTPHVHMHVPQYDHIQATQQVNLHYPTNYVQLLQYLVLVR